MSIVDGIARRLHDAGLGVYDPDNPIPKGSTPIALGSMPTIGTTAIVVTLYPGGPEPDSRNGHEFPRLQVRVRDKTAPSAMALERSVYEALAFRPGGPRPGALPGADPWWLQDCYALQSEAQPLGVDANGRHEYARNYQLDAHAGT